MSVSARGPGKKILFVDELWQWCDSRTIPTELEAIWPYWSGVDAAARLPKGQFLAYNRDSGETVGGILEPGWPPGRYRPTQCLLS